MSTTVLARALAQFAVLLLCGCAATLEISAPTHPASSPTESEKARILFDRHWEQLLRMYPEFGTFRGIHRDGDRLRDRSPVGDATVDAYWRSLDANLKVLDLRLLSPADRLSVEILQRIAGSEVALQPFEGLRTMTVNASAFPFQGSFAELLRASPTATTPQVEQILARIKAYPARMDQEIARLKRGKALGWVPPRTVLERVVVQLDAQLASPMETSPYFEPFTRLGNEFSAAQRQGLRDHGSSAVTEHVIAATRRLRDFVVTEYMASAPAKGGLSIYPDGAKAYEVLVRNATTTSLTPDEIHQIGLREVASLRRQMESVMRETGFGGDFAAWVKHLNSDPRFFHASGEELLAAYREIAKRIDPELPRLFAELPRASYGVRAMPAFLGPGAVETYTGPTLDGTRAGWFNANTVGFKSRPKWGLEALTAHETVPGHHLQTARAAELKDVPAFRRAAPFQAYNEGWALYAETLGTDLGLYRDPYTRFGFLHYQMWRAARLVVDTGLHVKGWSRQQAIDYMIECTLHPVRAESEVDRYLSDPAQALSYMIGQLKIIELRDRAKSALGARFDIRRFHNVVIDSGRVPLDVLDGLVDRWIASQSRGTPLR